MGPISAEAEIDVPRSRAFEFVCDLANRPAFTDHFVSGFHLTRIEPTGVGAGARFRFHAPPRAVWADTTIVEAKAPHRIVEHGHGGRNNRVPSTTLWELTEGYGSLTKVRVSYWTEPGNPLDKAKERLTAAAVWYERDWREAMRRLRDLLESEESPERRVAVAGGNRYATGIP
jgi:Polyketide cyclase / dehydrase and lipid transport